MSEKLKQNAPELTQRYEAAIEWVFGLINFEKKVGRSRDFRLDRTRRLLEAVGNPHEKIPAIHVAGTKGKGSTATMVASILSCAGFTTGLFTSPHITRFEERIRVDGAEPTKAEMVALVEQLRVIARGDDGLVPTYFEAAMVMAWCHYMNCGADFAVLEVGLGGRLDATNVCCPEVCIVTSISLDHTNVLGNTLEAIAGEKAGIIKEGVPVVSGVFDEPARGVIRSVANSRNAPLFELKREIHVEYALDGISESRTAVTTPWADYTDFFLPTSGLHQARNAALAVATVDQLRQNGHKVESGHIADGLARIQLPARLEVLNRQPLVIVDGSHNEASIIALTKALGDVTLAGPTVAIFAASQQKDAVGMLRQLLGFFDTVVVTQYLENPRAVPPGELRLLAEEISEQIGGGSWVMATTPAEAWLAASELQPGTVCVTGSFFIASELRKLIIAEREKPAGT